jgi:hypothetical protein
MRTHIFCVTGRGFINRLTAFWMEFGLHYLILTLSVSLFLWKCIVVSITKLPIGQIRPSHSARCTKNARNLMNLNFMSYSGLTRTKIKFSEQLQVLVPRIRSYQNSRSESGDASYGLPLILYTTPYAQLLCKLQIRQWTSDDAKICP